jgi:hypothetical protein
MPVPFTNLLQVFHSTVVEIGPSSFFDMRGNGKFKVF